jgi:hypothetical protein
LQCFAFIFFKLVGNIVLLVIGGNISRGLAKIQNSINRPSQMTGEDESALDAAALPPALLIPTFAGKNDSSILRGRDPFRECSDDPTFHFQTRVSESGG